MQLRALAPLALSLVCACGDTSNRAGADLGRTDDLAVGGDLAVAGDLAGPNDLASSPDLPSASGCVIKREASKTMCGDDCDARLTLPGGGWYCTVQCADTSDCGGAAGIICASFSGTCMPTCADNPTCTNQGFARCDTTEGACDTI